MQKGRREGFLKIPGKIEIFTKTKSWWVCLATASDFIDVTTLDFNCYFCNYRLFLYEF